MNKDNIKIEIGDNLLKAIKMLLKHSPEWQSGYLIEEAFRIDFTKIAKEKYKKSKI